MLLGVAQPWGSVMTALQWAAPSPPTIKMHWCARHAGRKYTFLCPVQLSYSFLPQLFAVGSVYLLFFSVYLFFSSVCCLLYITVDYQTTRIVIGMLRGLWTNICPIIVSRRGASRESAPGNRGGWRQHRVPRALLSRRSDGGEERPALLLLGLRFVTYSTEHC